MRTPHSPDLELRLQAAAEQVEAEPGLPPRDVAAYRQVYRAIRAAPMPPVAPGFAHGMELLTRDHEEQAMPEIWVTRVMVFAVLAGIPASIPALGSVAAAFARTAQGLPWSTVLATGLALAVAAVIDSTAESRRASQT